jgi:hypothetical protein
MMGPDDDAMTVWWPWWARLTASQTQPLYRGVDTSRGCGGGAQTRLGMHALGATCCGRRSRTVASARCGAAAVASFLAARSD